MSKESCKAKNLAVGDRVRYNSNWMQIETKAVRGNSVSLKLSSSTARATSDNMNERDWSRFPFIATKTVTEHITVDAETEFLREVISSW